MFSHNNDITFKELQARYDSELEKAMYAQNKGDILLYSKITSDAEKLAKKIRQLVCPESFI